MLITAFEVLHTFTCQQHGATYNLFTSEHPALQSLTEMWQPYILLDPKAGHCVARIGDWAVAHSQALILPATHVSPLAV